MAKNTKGGLGRGLNSLLGGTFETSAPAVPSPSRERVVVGEGDVPSYHSLSDARGLSSLSAAEPPRSMANPEKSHPDQEKLTLKTVLAKKLDEVPIDSVTPNPNQPRTNFKQEEIEELAASIEKDGLLQPILVRPIGEGAYQIIAGERRWQACKSIGLKTVPVRIREVDEDRALELALVENVQRSDLNPIEEAYGYKRLMERKNMTQADIAQAMSKGRSTVANALRLLDLPEEAQQLLFEDKITAGHARAILSVPSKEGRQTLTNKLVDTKLSVREAENLANLLSNKPAEGAPNPRQPTPKAYKSVAKALREILNTNVRVKSVRGKNKIEIEFKDEEELERLFEELIASVS